MVLEGLLRDVSAIVELLGQLGQGPILFQFGQGLVKTLLFGLGLLVLGKREGRHVPARDPLDDPQIKVLLFNGFLDELALIQNAGNGTIIGISKDSVAVIVLFDFDPGIVFFQQINVGRADRRSHRLARQIL